MESDIHPHGYCDEFPDPITNRPHGPYGFVDFNIFSDEVTKLLFVLDEMQKSKHYIISVPIFFTEANQVQLAESFKRSRLSGPSLAIDSADRAASDTLNTTLCPRHFEFDCAIDENAFKTIICLEYSNSTLSGSLLHFWGGRYTNRIA